MTSLVSSIVSCPQYKLHTYIICVFVLPVLAARLCPNFNLVLGQQLDKYHGSIDEHVIVKNILPTVQTGNLHAAVYDLTESLMHVSFCRSTRYSGG